MNDLFLDEIVRPEQPSSGAGARSARRAEREERARSRRKRRRRSIIALIVSLGILGGGAYFVVQYVMPMISGFSLPQDEEAADYPGPGHSTVDVTIAAGSSGTQMAQVLVEAGVVQSTSAFTGAFSANPSAPSIQPGTYRLLLEMRASDAVDALLDPANRVQVKVTFPEGQRVDQMLEKLSSVTTVPVEEFRTAMEDTVATGLPAEAGGNYEGWLFAATYTFEPGTTPTEMIATMVAETVGALDQRGVAPEDRLRVLTMASLVEREARTPEDRAKVARAIQNRLDINMKLDIDAAVAYGAAMSGLELTDEVLATDGPYNLYLRTGLPPTPIAAPSLVSLDAALAPAEGPWKFWVTINLESGETRFAEDFDEHQANVALLREWQAANPSE